MRIIILIMIIISFDSHAIAPTIYGKLNLMLRYIDQKASGFDSFVGPEDGTSPSRLGVKGGFKNRLLSTNYNLEAGFNPENDSLSIRLAEMIFSGNFGSIRIGQGWTTTGALGLILDPLAHTGASSWGSKTYNSIGGGVTHELGFLSTVRSDQIIYSTPTVGGFNLTIGNHRNNNQDRSSTSTNESLETLLQHQYASESFSMKTYIAHVATHGASSLKDQSMLLGIVLERGAISISTMYCHKQKESNTNQSVDQDHFLSSIKYKKNKNSYILLYVNRSDEYYQTKRNQVSLGYLYDLNTKVQFNLAVSHFHFMTEPSNPDYTNYYKNDAISFIAGATLNF